jgi:hypothetical protein
MSILDDLKLDKEVKKEVERQLKILEFKTVEITPKDEFIKMLAHSLQNNKPLRVKCGIDPNWIRCTLGPQCAVWKNATVSRFRAHWCRCYW